jgi:formamidopyrimidine-DNA glycosylase
MPELPEIYNLSNQMKKELKNKKIIDVVVIQEKSINMPVKLFIETLKENIIMDVTSKGKWIEISFESNMVLRINLGMGGDLIYSRELPTKKYQAHIELSNNYFISFRFWWFGHIHLIKNNEPHAMFDSLGVDLIRDSIDKKEFVTLFKNKKGSLKTALLNQKIIAGIGNYYIQDILFKSKINPTVKCNQVSEEKLENLYDIIINEFMDSIEQRGAFYELDFYGNNGTFKAGVIAYKEDQLCPVCNTMIQKIKTGSTSSYYCPTCQSN